MAQSMNSYMNKKRYQNNPYVKRKKYVNNYDRRMWRPGQKRPELDHRTSYERDNEIDYTKIPILEIPTEEEIDLALMPPEARRAREEHIRQQLEEQTDRSHFTGIDLNNRHRYGSAENILRTEFTKTKEELEKEKFLLIISVRKLGQKIFESLRCIPNHERFVLGSDLRHHLYELYKWAIAIKKRYYRKNLIEMMDIEIDILRELYRQAHEAYPDWINEARLNIMLEAIDGVGRILCGLLRAAVV